MILRTTPLIMAPSPGSNPTVDHTRATTATLSYGEGRTKETRRRRHIYERLVQNDHASHGDPPDGTLISQSRTKNAAGVWAECRNEE